MHLRREPGGMLFGERTTGTVNGQSRCTTSGWQRVFYGEWTVSDAGG
jgi:hypothetical protein